MNKGALISGIYFSKNKFKEALSLVSSYVLEIEKILTELDKRGDEFDKQAHFHQFYSTDNNGWLKTFQSEI